MLKKNNMVKCLPCVDESLVEYYNNDSKVSFTALWIKYEKFSIVSDGGPVLYENILNTCPKELGEFTEYLALSMETYANAD